ncbi:unnamed protein product [Prorocentrum cordatum]|uniref:Uncharacterized protein n=1 Tax=Prorocentrum cordatum TaxID=2364126 RepID=A0ABN9UPG9_9DINO|nr:unnamed protein product [Polarella glacialis]
MVPTPSPTWSPTSAAASSPTASSATGDPHLQNMFGQRFDLARPGISVLVRVPRGMPVEDALLVVKADARRLGARCSDIYFQEINVTGTWAHKAQPGGFRFDARGARAENEKPRWLTRACGAQSLQRAHRQGAALSERLCQEPSACRVSCRRAAGRG